MAPSLRMAWKAPWPAMLLATLLLVPFLNTPFTIDDPIYLREAQHALVEPIHPQAFNMVWSTDLNLRASQILPGGIAFPYLLIPAAIAGCPEWAAHLTQLLMLLAALLAATLLALRLGLEQREARWVALLMAACPAVLGMAGTVMPDIAAMLFVTLGMERLAAWRDQRKWPQALFATIYLALAALTRTHTILILAPAAVLLLDGIGAEEIRASLRKFRRRFLPLVLVPLFFAAATALTSDPDFQGRSVVGSLLLPYGLHLVILNACAYLAHWLLVVPLTIPWLVFRFRQIPFAPMVVVLLGASFASLRLGWAAFAAGASALVLIDILFDAIKRRDRLQLALWLWLLLPFPIVVYLHLPSKYLLPCVSAASLLVVRLASTRRETSRWLLPSAAVAGALLGILILLGIHDLAATQKRAVADLIEPYVALGNRVWFAGHWGFQWYAELAGASPVNRAEPELMRGDIIVVSFIDLPIFAQKWKGQYRVLQSRTYPSGGPGKVMDMDGHAGFFSNPYGYLPWTWGSGSASRFEVWEVRQPPN